MTLQQLEERLLKLEEKFQELEQQITPTTPTKPWRNTFGMFADDPDFDEVLRLGREYREQENQRTS
ncbi:MAG TPA: hypothetical protein VMM76_24295 [Pirellulaceae bacterium]|nr:hypothetical protein [Pirellulaceae bacterium]